MDVGMAGDVAGMDLADPAGTDHGDFKHRVPIQEGSGVGRGECNVFSNFSTKSNWRFMWNGTAGAD
jgi:hypothetical protein